MICDKLGMRNWDTEKAYYPDCIIKSIPTKLYILRTSKRYIDPHELKWFYSIYCARKVVHGFWYISSSFYTTWPKVRYQIFLKHLPTTLDRLQTLKIFFLIAQISFAKSQLKLSPIDNHCEIWRPYDRGTRVACLLILCFGPGCVRK
jgi:hypothetical protein